MLYQPAIVEYRKGSYINSLYLRVTGFTRKSYEEEYQLRYFEKYNK